MTTATTQTRPVVVTAAGPGPDAIDRAGGRESGGAAPTIVRDRPPTAARVRATWLQSMGRRVVLGALARITIGRVDLIDGSETHRSPGGGAGRGTGDATGATSKGDAPGDVGVPHSYAARHVTVRVLDPRFYSAAAFGGSVGIGEAYMDGLWETDDLPGLIERLTVNLAAQTSLESPIVRLLRPLTRLRYALQRNSLVGSRRNIRAHYDLSNEFFATFLDPSMTYSCAIFTGPDCTLEAAQAEKIDRACRKLELSPADHLLEIGTGWGALAMHAAGRYGCRVTTTTISDRQFDLATARVRDAGLSDRVTIVKDDYRNLRGQFDKLVSIEMIEAVGRDNLDTYFASCSRLLRPHGAALIQAITIRDQAFEAAAARMDWLKKYIFPGSCLLGIEAMLNSVRRATDLRPANIEDIGPHYVATLAEWRRRFHARLDDVRTLGFDDRFIRMWDYYLAYSQGVFASRHTGDVQLLLAKPLWRGDSGCTRSFS